MALVEINWHPNRRELRQFGVSMLVGFGLFAAIAGLYWDRPRLAVGFVVFGALAGALGLSGRRVAMLVYGPWMAIAFVMGNIMSRLFIAVFYFLLITPMGLLMRLRRIDPLQRRNTRDSYWDDLPVKSGRSRSERQF